MSIIKELLLKDRNEPGEENSLSATDDIDDSKLDVSLLGNILECQLEEGQPTEEWSHALSNWESSKEPDCVNDNVWPYPYPMFPRHVHSLVFPGSLPSTVKNLLCQVKLAPNFTKAKSRSLKDLKTTDDDVLDDLLMKLRRDKYLQKPVQWMATKNIILNTCDCGSSRHLQDDKFFVWICNSCNTMKPVILPPLLEQLLQKFKLPDILAVVLHWSFQSDLYCIMIDTVLNVNEIWEIWMTLRHFCISFLEKHRSLCLSKFSAETPVIEGAVFQYGPFIIVGIMDRRTKFTIIESFRFDTSWNAPAIMALLKRMLSCYEPPFMFISDYVLFRPIVEEKKADFRLVDGNISDPDDAGFHNLNIVQYITNIMSASFKRFSSKLMCYQDLHSCLYELQWRERYGPTEVMAFWSIIYMIAGQHDGKPGSPREWRKNKKSSDLDNACAPNNSCSISCYSISSTDTDSSSELTQPSEECTQTTKETCLESSKSEIIANASAILPSLTGEVDECSSNYEVIVPDTSEVLDDAASIPKSSTDEVFIKQDVEMIVEEQPHTQVLKKTDEVTSDTTQILPVPVMEEATDNPESCSPVSETTSASVKLKVQQRWSSRDISKHIIKITQGYTHLTINNLLSMKTWPLLLTMKGYEIRHEIDAEKDVDLFREKLVQQKYFDTPIQWMVNHHLVHEHQKCDVCNNDRFYLTMDQGSGRLDKYCWICTSPMCGAKKPLRRLKFFTLFGFPMGGVLQLIFHWAAQTNMEDIKKKINFNEYKIRYVYWAIQKLLSKVIANENPLLGDNGQIVELGIVQLGNYNIIGVADRQTKLTRLIAVPCPSTYSAAFIETYISMWLMPYTIVVTKTQCFSFHDKQLILMKEVPLHVSLGTSIIEPFLSIMVKNLFSRFSMGSVKLEMIQAFLDEIQWRERYGLVPEAAFWNVFHHISQDDNSGISTGISSGSLPQISEVGVVPPEVFSNTPVVSQATAEIAVNNTEPKEIPEFPTPVLVVTNPVSLENSNEPVATVTNCLEGPVISSVVSDATVEYLSSSSSDNSTDSIDVELICEEFAVTPSQSKQLPGVTVLNEEDLLKELNNTEAEEKPAKDTDTSTVTSESRQNDQLWWDARCLTLSTKHTKILKPVLVDCMSFLKKPTRSNSQDCKDEITVSLDEYYFARKKPVIPPTEPDRTYTFCCTICKRTLFNNIDVIHHTLAHATEEDLDRREFKLKNCPYCFKQYHSTREINLHVKLVHRSNTSLSCLVCSIMFPTMALLESHMKCSHVPSEMPFYCSVCYFRSSQHYEVFDHFKKTHKFEPHLMCPFCLKVCSPRAKTDEVLYTLTYCQHLLKHQLETKTSKCPTCSLSFLSLSEVKIHVLKDHISFANKEGVFPYKPRLNPVIVISVIPTPKEFPVPQILSTSTIVPPSVVVPQALPYTSASTSHSQTSSTTSCDDIPVPPAPESPPCFIIASTQSIATDSAGPVASQWNDIKQETDGTVAAEEKDDSVVCYDISDECKCLECGANIDKDHFFKLLRCYCSYNTNCVRAFMSHVMNEHGITPQRKAKKRRMNSDLIANCLCSCGSTLSSADQVADHVRGCSGQLKVLPSATSSRSKSQLADTVPQPQVNSQLYTILEQNSANQELELRYPTGAAFSPNQRNVRPRLEAQMPDFSNVGHQNFPQGFPDLHHQQQKNAPNYIYQGPNAMMPSSANPLNRFVIRDVIHPNYENYMMTSGYLPMNHSVQYIKEAAPPPSYNPYMMSPGPRIVSAESIPGSSNINIIHHVNQFSSNAQTFLGVPQQVDTINVRNVYPQNSSQYIVQPHSSSYDMPQLEPLYNNNNNNNMNSIKKEPVD